MYGRNSKFIFRVKWPDLERKMSDNMQKHSVIVSREHTEDSWMRARRSGSFCSRFIHLFRVSYFYSFPTLSLLPATIPTLTGPAPDLWPMHHLCLNHIFQVSSFFLFPLNFPALVVLVSTPKSYPQIQGLGSPIVREPPLTYEMLFHWLSGLPLTAFSTSIG